MKTNKKYRKIYINVLLNSQQALDRIENKKDPCYKYSKWSMRLNIQHHFIYK